MHLSHLNFRWLFLFLHVEKSIRKIIHIDIDAFYASVEQRDHPEYRNKPVVVGKNNDRGVIAAASYEARKYGVHSAMPSKVAVKKCPHLIFVKSGMEKYKQISKSIRDIFYRYTDLVEPLSIDEAFLDVTTNKMQMQSATFIAKQIKQTIREEHDLTASAGVSFNKFLAKTASDQDKPNGLFVITPEESENFLETLPIEKIFGIGKVTAKTMHGHHIYTGKDLKQAPLVWLKQKFGKAGVNFYNLARGIDNREVEPLRIRKSAGTERTFEKDLTDRIAIIAELYSVEKELMERLQKSGFKGKTLTLKIKYHDFEQITRSKTLLRTIEDFNTLHRTSKSIFGEIKIVKPIRLLGLSVSNIWQDNEQQLTINF